MVTHTRLAGELLSVWAFNGFKSKMTGCNDNNVGGTLKPHVFANTHRVMETPLCLTDSLKPTHYACISLQTSVLSAKENHMKPRCKTKQLSFGLMVTVIDCIHY